MINNDIAGAFIAGILVFAFALGIFQFGLNWGITVAIQMMEEYPAAAKFLTKHKKMAHVIPYIIKNKSEEVS